MSQKRERSPEHATEGEDSVRIFRSKAIEDRASTFRGYYSPTLTPKELQKLAEISSADHKILALRKESNQQAITGGVKYVSEHDDDGEKYAGKRVQQVLDSMQVTGACVVARWYGGVLLGPVRFTHIETCARGAIQTWKDSQLEEQAKKKQARDDASDKVRLVNVLTKRDQSIEVLRELAAEKENRTREGEQGASRTRNGAQDTNEKTASQTASPKRPVTDYADMPVDRLRALERARDATLSFLLKRIDKAEAELEGKIASPDEHS